MHDLNTVVVKKSLKITVVHKVVNTNLSFLQPYFTEIEPYYSDKKPNMHRGVLSYHGLNGLLKRLNTYISSNKKFDAPAILKGIYKGGTNGHYCNDAAPFLFFDVDVKKDENRPLQDAYVNAEVFEQLQKVALLVWRSNSQKGMAGILYVPQFQSIDKTETAKHLKIGNAITGYLSKYLLQLGFSVSFDTAQNKFRQIRFLAEQRQQRTFNERPYTFNYEIQEMEAPAFNGVRQYQFENPKAVNGSIRQQFNTDNPIDQVILNCGFTEVDGTNRYKHSNTTSSSSGNTDPIQNIFFNYSSSFSNKKAFYPFELVLWTQYDNDKKAFLRDLKQKGYSIKKPQQNIVKDSLKKLIKPNLTDKEIFAACYDLRNLPIDEKIALINENCKSEKDRQLYCTYLKCKNLEIGYDAHFKIEKYVSEVLGDVLNIADTKKKVILRAETGTGKTTSVLRDFLKHRPNERCLLLVPLTVIVEQSANDYKDIIGLTGKSSPLDHTKAKTAKLVIATYEQGIKHLQQPNNFDYVVIDEVHNILLGNNYKRETITQLTALLEYKKVIGLTGTPNNLFKEIGYSLLSVSKKVKKPVEIIQRVDNRNPAKIVIQHLQSVRGKCIFRLNDTKTINELQKELIKTRQYRNNEILVLYSSHKIKNSNEYLQIINKSQFPDEIKIVLTTALIDEGINIEQLGFTDVIFIETEYSPNPEPLKQFFARFRNTDPSRKNYHYFKKKNSQEPIYWNEKKDFAQRLEILTKNTIDDLNSYKDLTNDNNFYYDNLIINKYYLAHEVHNKFLSFFNHYEFNYYLTKNFNIEIKVDDSYTLSSIDISEISKSLKNEKQRIAEHIYNNWEQTETAISRITTDKKLKKVIEDIGQPVDNNIMDFVQVNVKTFERYCRYYYQLLETGQTDPLNYLTDGVKLKDPRKINRDIKLYETINLIERPKTKRDVTNQAKLLSFLSDIENNKKLDLDTMTRLWNKQKVTNNNSFKNKHLIDLVSHYTQFDFDTKNNRFFYKD